MNLGQAQITRNTKTRTCDYEGCEDEILRGNLYITIFRKNIKRWYTRLHPECWARWAILKLVAHWAARRAAGRPVGSKFTSEVKRRRLALQKRRARLMSKILDCTTEKTLFPLVDKCRTINAELREQDDGNEPPLNKRFKGDLELARLRVATRKLIGYYGEKSDD